MYPLNRGDSPQRDHDRRNFVINIVEGSLFISGATFISLQTVLPTMVNSLGGGNLAVGALGVIAWGGLFLPQVFSARYVETFQWKKPWTLRLGFVQRILVAVAALLIFIFGESDPSIALSGFLVLYAVMHLVLGTVTPAWFDLVAKVTPVTKRGRLAGFRSSLGGVIALGCGVALTWVLSHYPAPLNYTIAFSLAFALQALSLVVQSGLVEAEPSKTVAKVPVLEFLRQVPSVFKENKGFRNFIVAMMFLVLATISVTFFTVYALEAFQADASTAGIFTMVMVGGQVMSAPAVGYLGDRYGNRASLITAASALLCATICALLAPTLEWFYLVFAFLGVNLGSELMARYNIAMEFAPELRRATYFGLMNAMLAPFYAVSLLGGWLSDLFGYRTVFHIGGACSLAGILLLVYFVKEPRSANREAAHEG